MSDTEIRAKFEAWAGTHGYEVCYLPLVHQYDDGDTQDAWLGWKACAQLAAPVAAQEPVAWMVEAPAESIGWYSRSVVFDPPTGAMKPGTVITALCMASQPAQGEPTYIVRPNMQTGADGVTRPFGEKPAQGERQPDDAAMLDWLEANPGFNLNMFITWRNESGEYDGVERNYWQITTNHDDECEAATLRGVIAAAMQLPKPDDA